jgi:hypothetical protein
VTEILDGMPRMPGTDDGTGLVGNRQLVAVQMFDIARLTTNPVPVVPGTFVAVTGDGPKGDSNGSGKTSFLAAVSLLHGESQWRLETNGGQSAAGLLFKPAAAGVADAAYRPADHGYVVGVFADKDQPDSGQITVWMRISTTAPYVTVRHAEGLHVAHGATDQERYEQADGLWAELGRAGTLGSRKLTTALYGDAPRCMAYLDTTLRPGAPSLLSQQMTEMTPERIGESLIALTGREGLLDSEQEQRRLLAEQQLGLKAKEDDDVRQRLDEQTELTALEDRDRSRALLADGEHLWRLHFARGYLDAAAEDARLGALVDTAAGEVVRAQEKVDAETAVFEELRQRTDLAEAEAEAKAEVDRLEARAGEAARRGAFADRDLDRLAEQRRALLAARDGWDGRTVEAAQQAVGDATGALNEAIGSRIASERERDRLAAALREAEAGGGGPAGQAVAALAAAGVQAVPLLDVISLDDGARGAWEPRLWLHRTSAVVAPRDEDAATQALARLPGASIIVAEGPLDSGMADSAGARASVPLGRFLDAVAARTEHRPRPDRAIDTALAETTVGGFATAVAGRAARVEAARTALAEAEVHVTAALQTERTARLVADDAVAHLAASQAVADLDALKDDEARLRREKTSAEDAGKAVQALLDPAKHAHLEAAATARNHAQQVLLAAETVRLCERERDDAKAKLRERQDERARVTLGYWQRGWGGTAEEAQTLLDAQPDTVSTGRAASLRRRAAEALKDALDAYLRGVSERDVPPDLAEAQRRRQLLADGGAVGGDTVDFTTVARPLRDLLDGLAERDEVQSDRIRRDQAKRADELEALGTEVARLNEDLRGVQDMVASSIDAALSSISGRLDALNRRRGGFGAELRVAYDRPDSPAALWRWKVTPRWRRSPAGPLISYREVANGAQVKVFAIQLVLAALLAADGGTGRVLVLDELGNSLGDENRKDVLADLDEAARDQNVTIFGACQNSVIEDAAARCGQILWFSHASHTDAFNKPTRAWGFDDDGRRVDAIAPWLREGRTLA